jgi:Ca2+-binding RTX toxin-like protein
MATLSVLDGVFDYSNNGLVVADTNVIAFNGAATAQACFSDDQFGTLIANNVYITNEGLGAADLCVTLTAQPYFSAQNWTFGTWGAGDKITINGSSLNDVIVGSIKADSISGGSGNDTITSNGGADSLDGGIGSADLLVLDRSQAASAIAVSVTAFTVGYQFKDSAFAIGFERLNLIAGTGHDSLMGGSLADTLVGGEGHDTLDGGLGGDKLYGGAGDDVVMSGAGNSLELVMDGGAGSDTLVVNRATATTALQLSATLFSDVGGGWSFSGFEKFWVTGGGGHDVLTGGAFADTLSGGAGNDTISGGISGGDSLDGGAGLEDLLVIDRRTSTADSNVSVGALTSGFVFDNLTSAINFERLNLVAGSGNDTLTGGALGDTLEGGAGNDILTGSGGLDMLRADQGDDSVFSADADLILDGGLGFDTLVLQRTSMTNNIFFDANATLPAILPDQTQIMGFEIFAIETGSGADTITGGSYADWIFTFAGRDGLYGGGGNDTLGGGDGGDTLDGGAGNDRLLGEQGYDVLDGGIGDDTLDGADGNDVLDAGLGNDWLSGGDGFDQLDGGEGADLLNGGSGNDTLLGGAGADFIYCGDANDVSEGGAGGDIMLGEAGNDQLQGGDGNDFIFGGLGLNLLAGGLGDDVLYSQGVSDTLDGGQGDQDQYYRQANGVSLTTGGAGIDQFIGGTWLSNDTVYGGDGNDYLFGGDGDDLLVGDGGNDVILGQNGNDILDGGAGVNAIWANDAGSDQVRVNVADAGIQVLQGFEAGGINDAVRLLGSTLTDFSQIEALRATLGLVINGNAIYNTGVGCQLYLNVGANQTAIWFQGVSVYSLTSGDFLFG